MAVGFAFLSDLNLDLGPLVRVNQNSILVYGCQRLEGVGRGCEAEDEWLSIYQLDCQSPMGGQQKPETSRYI